MKSNQHSYQAQQTISKKHSPRRSISSITLAVLSSASRAHPGLRWRVHTCFADDGSCVGTKALGQQGRSLSDLPPEAAHEVRARCWLPLTPKCTQRLLCEGAHLDTETQLFESLSFLLHHSFFNLLYPAVETHVSFSLSNIEDDKTH